MSDYFNKLVEFIKNSDWDVFFDEDIDKSTSVQRDAGLYGDEAIDFIKSYSHHFGVDVSNFDAKKYFLSEGGLNVLFTKRAYKKSSLPDLRLSDLAIGIKDKHLE